MNQTTSKNKNRYSIFSPSIRHVQHGYLYNAEQLKQSHLTCSSSFVLSKASKPAFNVALLSGVGSIVNAESSVIYESIESWFTYNILWLQSNRYCRAREGQRGIRDRERSGGIEMGMWGQGRVLSDINGQGYQVFIGKSFS